MIQILPDTDDGAMHVSIRARETSAPGEAGEARRIATNFAMQLTTADVAVEEMPASWGLVATSGFDVPEANQRRHLELHVAVADSCIVASTWNDQGGSEQTRQAVHAIFRSIYLTPADR